MTVALVVLAKAPLPGLAKTRLARTVGQDAAAEVARCLLEHALQAAVASGLAVTLCGSPGGHPLLLALTEQAGVALTAQVDGDLGRRLASAMTQALEVHEGVLVMGSDCPGLTPQHLRLAAEQLNQHDAVLFPAHDGGYTLIGLRANPAGLFDDMPWSTEQVLPETLRRMALHGWRVWLGETLHDIDTEADLIHLPSHWPRPAALAEQAP